MTNPSLAVRPSKRDRYRRSEITAVIGHGDAVWERASRDVMRWRVKTASGFEVFLTVRSLTRAAPQQPWRALYPLLRIAQLIARRRYLRALQ